MGDIAHQLGLAEESTWATPVTPNRFVEFTTETLEKRKNVVSSAGIRSGVRYGGQGRRVTSHDAGGSFTAEVATTGFGVFFKHLLGGVATVNPLAGVYEHTITPGTLTGLGLTLQKGVEKPDGTVQAFTYPGSKIVAAQLSIGQRGLLMASLDVDAQQEETATALASASYTTPTIFAYSEGVLKKDTVAVASVRSVPNLRIQNNLLTKRFFLGSSGLKSEPLNVPFDALTGALDVEFRNLTDFYNAYAADTALELILEFAGGVISGGHNFTFRVTINNARLEGETPKISGPDLVYQNVPFVGLDHASEPAVEIFYKTSDALP